MTLIMSLRPPFKLPGKPSYYYEIDRKRRSLKTADKTEAMRLFNAIRREYLAGRVTQITGDCNKSLGEFIDEYTAWAEHAQLKATYKANRLALDKLVAEEGRAVRLDRITLKAIDKLIATGRKNKNSTNTINCYIRHLKSVFNKPVEWGDLKANPFRGAKQLPKEVRPPAYIPQKNVGTFLSGIEGRSLKLLISAYLATGRRRCELLNLQWEDVDLKGRRYFVRKSKTHLARWYPASKDFLAVLKAVGPKKSGPVFAAGHPDTVSKRVKAELKKAGFGGLRLHDLRHSFAVLFIQAEGGLRTLQELLGHTQYQTTEIYAHVADDHLNEAVNKVKLGPILNLIK